MYLTTRDVCDRLKVSRWTVSRLIKSGELTAIKGAGRNGRIRISEDSLKRYITQHSVEITES